MGDRTCNRICPEVFAYDEEKFYFRVLMEVVPSQLETRVRQATEECPVKAIVIEGIRITPHANQEIRLSWTHVLSPPRPPFRIRKSSPHGLCVTGYDSSSVYPCHPANTPNSSPPMSPAL